VKKVKFVLFAEKRNHLVSSVKIKVGLMDTHLTVNSVKVSTDNKKEMERSNVKKNVEASKALSFALVVRKSFCCATLQKMLAMLTTFLIIVRYVNKI